MQGHVDRFRRAGGGGAWADMELEARAALHYLRREANAQALAEAVDVLCKLQVNCFSRLDEDVEQTGLFMNPALAMVNHSCTPNAFVQFAGREAVLHAYRAIEKGEEIEISYIDCNLHLSNRQEALQTRYHFTCSCPRCKDDLDPYQVCQKYPHLDLNNLSVAPEVSKVRDSQAPGLFSGGQSLSATIEEIYPWCAASLQDLSEPDQRKQLRRRWKACGPLRDPGVRAYAVEPLPLVLAEAGMYLGGRGDFAAALCVAAFRAVHADPYANPAPFAPARVKGLLLVAKLLANTAPAPAPTTPGRDVSSSPGGRPRADVSVALAAMDQVTMCQALLELVAYHAPAAQSKGWRVAREASDLLDDIEALPGRDTEGALVKAFIRNPDGAEERRFFEQAVLGPLRDLAGFCLNIMDEEFGP
ncbi:putative SET and MYND protein [Rosellinia necatrix]|uniref:Putative SET and MYND protein n=1 Tax=Rosellinia necatrix TaxID=77044 RepID=A0A1S7UK25_ROSNE|nr:putative SET and MYND protein [Rosellinia necatrix]